MPALRMWGQYIIQPDLPEEDPVILDTLWMDQTTGLLKKCTAVAPYAFTAIAGGAGTVTSVGMTVPTGLSVSGSPITSSGTLAVTLASGYMIPGGGNAGDLLTSQGASAPIFVAPASLTKVDDTNVTLTLGGSATVALVATASLTLGWSGQLALSRGGTAANLTAVNGAVVYSTATAFALSAAGVSGQVLTSQGAAAPIWTTPTTGTVTSVAMTVPTGLSVSGSPITTSGTLAVTLTAGYVIPGGGNAGDLLTSQGASAPTFVAPAALTKADDTNVTLTLGGSPTTALINAASITAGWTGVLAGSRGGTGYSSVKAAGIAYGLSTNYISGTGTAGADNTAQTVKTISVPANTLTQVGDQLHIRIFWRADTGTGVIGTITLNGVSVGFTTSGTITETSFLDTYLSYVDSTHANIRAFGRASGGGFNYNSTVSVENTAGFDWTIAQDLDFDQSAVLANHAVVFEMVGTVYPKGVVAA